MNRIYMIFVAISLCFGAEAQRYSNPLTDVKCADPAVVYDEASGHFIAFGTPGEGYRQYLVSEDMVTWKESGKYLYDRQTHERIHEYGRYVWAPDLVRIGDRWMLYLAVTTPAEKVWRIVSLSSPSLDEPFRFEGLVTDSRKTVIKDSIDPEVFEADGKVWMIFGSTGGVFLVQMTDDGSTVAPGAEYIHVAGIDVVRDRTRAQSMEGCCLYRHDGWWYLFASVGAYNNETYRIVAGRSRSFKGPFKTREGKPMRKGYGDVILSTESGSCFFGPGHNGDIFTDGKGDSWMYYHCHVRSEDGRWGPRYLFLQKLLWDADGWPCFEGGHPVSVSETPVLPLMKQPKQKKPSRTVHISSISEITAGCPVSDFNMPERRCAVEVNHRSYVTLSREALRVTAVSEPGIKIAEDGKFHLYYRSESRPEQLWCSESSEGLYWSRGRKAGSGQCGSAGTFANINGRSFIKVKDVKESGENPSARNILVSTSYVNRELDVAEMTPKLDGTGKEWIGVSDAMFIGSKGQAQCSYRFAADRRNMYVIVDCLDDEVRDGDSWLLMFGNGKDKSATFMVRIEAADGSFVLSDGVKGKVSAVPGEGFVAEIAVPEKSLALTDGRVYFNAGIVKEGGSYKDGMSGVKTASPSTWIPIIVRK